MRPIAIIKSIYRYPVKSMAGEQLTSAVLGWHGIEGDRRFAFMRAGNMSGMPWLTASKLPELIRYNAYRTNGSDPETHSVRVRTPGGSEFEVEHESLRRELSTSFGAEVTLTRLSNGIFDDAPVSLISTTTLNTIETESGCTIDVRRFRPNILIESVDDMPVHEDTWVGKTLFFDNQVNAPSIRVTVQDVRCVMVNLDPETAASDPRVLKTIGHSHENCAGVYASVLNIGTLTVGERVYMES
jgi:uncharacterized protein YcbX